MTNVIAAKRWLTLEQEVVVVVHKPLAVQCIKRVHDEMGCQTCSQKPEADVRGRNHVLTP